jgi:hypothetical protein
MAGIITTGSAPKALWPGISAWWGTNYNEHGLECNDLFDFRTSNKSYEEVVEAIGFGLAPVKEQGSSTQYASWQQGTVNRFTNDAYALGFIVTHEERKDNLYEELVMQRTQRLAMSMRTTKEIVAANIYNRAFNPAYVYGDTVSLISTAHPTKDGTQSNRLAVDADLSEQSLEDMVIQIDNTKDSAGLQIKLMAKTLHIPTQLRFTASRIMDSVLQNDTANNAINALKATGAVSGGYKVNHYFTDTDAWFIRTDATDGMIAFQREEMDFAEDNDFDTKNLKYAAYERWTPGAGDFRGIFGTSGA